jgi:hypothetical protein
MSECIVSVHISKEYPFVVKILKSVAPKIIFICIIFAGMGLISQGLGYLCHLDVMPLSDDGNVPAGYDLSYWADVKATPLSREELKRLTDQTRKNSDAYKQALDNHKGVSVDTPVTQVASSEGQLP